MTLNKHESDIIYIMKAIGIITVVIGHYSGILSNITQPYLYHMPLFFFIGGMLINGKKPVHSSIKVSYKILKYLIFSYFIIGLFSLEFNYYFGSDFGVSFSNDIFHTLLLVIKSNFHSNNLFLIGWFLFSYLFSSVLTISLLSLSSLINNDKLIYFLLLLIAVLFGYISVVFFSHLYSKTANQLYNVISQVLYASMFMIFGCFFRRFLIKINISIKLSLFILSIIIISFNLEIIKPLTMSWSIYPSGFLLSTLFAIMSIVLIFKLSQIIAKTKNHYFILIGKNSQNIMFYHLICFVLLDLLFYYTSMWDISKTTVFNHYSFPLSDILYIFIGVSTPVIFSTYKEKIKNNIYKYLS